MKIENKSLFCDFETKICGYLYQAASSIRKNYVIFKYLIKLGLHLAIYFYNNCKYGRTEGINNEGSKTNAKIC